MLAKIPILSCLAFGVLYPLSFWLSAKDPIKNNFHRFHLGSPVVIAGLSIVGFLLFPGLSWPIIILAMGWLMAALVITAISWKKETVSLGSITMLSLSGLLLYARVNEFLLGGGVVSLLVGIIAGLVLAVSFYAMNLGHFYLNVHGLNIKHLRVTTVAFAFILGLRLLWDICYVMNAQVMYGGESISLVAFSLTMDGFFIWVAIFFGALMPLLSSYFAFGTLKLRNTQATTGILYVLLSAILLGDLACKYYWFKFHIYI